MPKQFLHFVEAPALVDQHGGKVVAQVVQPYVLRVGLCPDAVPGVVNMLEPGACSGVGKYVVTIT